ncbi:MAG: dethiobiotin synthase [Rhodocyclaceae bacterium]|nr:dethiobiotin synthase [Rhodocyclaceae bacterium]
MIPAPHGGCFVVGTDTGVGKTLVACALLHALRAAGLAPLPMKPVASGSEPSPEGPRNDDVTQLIAASGRDLTQDEVAPFRYLPPIAPHIAAAEAGQPIDLEHLVALAAQLAQRGPLVVEGAGGFLVPIDAQRTLADLAAALGLPMVLVVGMRLGCLNHALLTAEALAARGLRLAGWVANGIDPQFERAEANLATLAARLPAPLLAAAPWSASPDPAALAATLRLPALA